MSEPGKPRPPEPTERGVVYSPDGTAIAYRMYGFGDPTLVLSPGLATPPIVYDYVLEHFADRLRILTWDMRGTFASSVPAGGPSALRVEDSVRDLVALADHLGLGSFALGGWSMGVQISLEYYHRFPERCQALVLIAGGYGHVLRDAFHIPLADKILSGVLKLSRPLGAATNASVRWLLGQQTVMKLLETTQLVTANMPFFLDVVAHFRELDFERYAEMLLKLHEHNAGPYLSEVEVPTLIIAGTKDRMTPLHTAQTMAEEIAGAELVVIENGTHYTPLEYPEQLNAALDPFLAGVFPDALKLGGLGGASL